MRFEDEDNPKKPRPIRSGKKPIGAPESGEAAPWSDLFEDARQDRHRHVT